MIAEEPIAAGSKQLNGRRMGRGRSQSCVPRDQGSAGFSASTMIGRKVVTQLPNPGKEHIVICTHARPSLLRRAG